MRISIALILSFFTATLPVTVVGAGRARRYSTRAPTAQRWSTCKSCNQESTRPRTSRKSRQRILDPVDQRMHDYLRKCPPSAVAPGDSSRRHRPVETSPRRHKRRRRGCIGNKGGGRAVSKSDDKAQLRPEYVLDGSNTRKEIVFEWGRQKSPADATPTPSPAGSGSAKLKAPALSFPSGVRAPD